MKSIKVDLGNRSYDIKIGSGILSQADKFISPLDCGKDAVIITNSLIKQKYGKVLNKAINKLGGESRFFLIADTEKSKSVASVIAILKQLAVFDHKKDIFIIALGGGVVGDLAGFVASIYKRGINYVQIPTTLLSQVDSAIGGKTAVDLPEGKNLVGTFYQPRVVLSDVDTLSTLSLRQVRNGVAEVIKYGLIRDKELFVFLENNYQKILKLNPQALECIINRCAAIKASVVANDEFDKKDIRAMLNFGHTIGHAIEVALGYALYQHGEAISLGMLVASGISQRIGWLNREELLRVENIIKLFGLPSRIEGVSFEKVFKAHYRDKKFRAELNKFVLLKGIGRAEVKVGIDKAIICSALKERF